QARATPEPEQIQPAPPPPQLPPTPKAATTPPAMPGGLAAGGALAPMPLPEAKSSAGYEPPPAAPELPPAPPTRTAAAAPGRGGSARAEFRRKPRRGAARTLKRTPPESLPSSRTGVASRRDSAKRYRKIDARPLQRAGSPAAHSRRLLRFAHRIRVAVVKPPFKIAIAGLGTVGS